MPASLTRRSALGGAAVAALASCGGDDSGRNGGPSAGSGAALLSSIVALEHAAVAAWGTIGASLSGEARYQARAIRRREIEHVARVSALVRDRGGTPPAGRAEADYDPLFPKLGGESDALHFARDLEEQLVRAYLDALAALPDAHGRREAARIAAEEAEDLAVVQLMSGEPAAAQAFVTGTS